MKRKLALGILCSLGVPLILFSQSALEVARVSLTVSDLELAKSFYTGVLLFELADTYEWRGEEFQQLMGIEDQKVFAKVALLRLGEEELELIEFVNESRQRSIPLDAKSNDLWFQHIAIVVSDMEKAYSRLREFKVEHVSTAPQTLPEYIPAAAGIRAFYFQDPDGHILEIIYFPEGKGDAKWQNRKELFLGIDHTAIGIADTDRSNAFYEDLLGLRVAGQSENYGNEQEHLNQVFGARLIITGLRAQIGPGIEFLDYLAPPGGRPYPADSAPTDLWHWHTSIKVTNLDLLFQQFLKSNVKMISPGIVHAKGIGNKGSSKSLLIRDVDGHGVLLFE